ncbi:MAG: hypothetical protein K6D94_09740 [Clostridiales bacterium]|nr:hypothetical protein [Clostridiales bacterium]
MNAERYNAETKRAIKETLAGINLVGPFSTVEELRSYLDGDDFIPAPHSRIADEAETALITARQKIN